MARLVSYAKVETDGRRPMGKVVIKRDVTPEEIAAMNARQAATGNFYPPEHPKFNLKDADTTQPTQKQSILPDDLTKCSKDELFDIATKLGIDPSTIEGTGASGNVLKEDLIAAIEEVTGS